MMFGWLLNGFMRNIPPFWKQLEEPFLVINVGDRYENIT